MDEEEEEVEEEEEDEDEEEGEEEKLVVKEKVSKLEFEFREYKKYEMYSDGDDDYKELKRYIDITVSSGDDKISYTFVAENLDFDSLIKELKQLYRTIRLLSMESSRKEVAKEAILVVGKLLYLILPYLIQKESRQG